jgi:hypothetical protein
MSRAAGRFGASSGLLTAIGSGDYSEGYWPRLPHGPVHEIDLSKGEPYRRLLTAIEAHVLWCPRFLWAVIVPTDDSAIVGGTAGFVEALLDEWPSWQGIPSREQARLVVEHNFTWPGFDYSSILSHLYGEAEGARMWAELQDSRQRHR